MLLASRLTTEQQHYAQVADASAKSLLGVIGDILDFSKIEAGRLEIDELNFNLRALLDDLAGMMAGRLAKSRCNSFVHWCPMSLCCSREIRGACARC